jgi:hypothetical protein
MSSIWQVRGAPEMSKHLEFPPLIEGQSEIPLGVLREIILRQARKVTHRIQKRVRHALQAESAKQA